MVWWKDALNKVQDAVADPRVINTAKIVNGALTVAATVKDAKLGGPLGVAGAALGILDVVNDVLEIEKPDPAKMWLDQHKDKLVTHVSYLPLILSNCGLLEHLQPKTFATGPRREYRGFTQGEEMFVWSQNKGASEPRRGEVYKTKGFDMSFLRQTVWQLLGGPIVKLVTAANGTSLESSQYGTGQYLGKRSVEDFAAAIALYKSRGISRASLLDGPPGTGKTSFVRAYVRHIGGTLLVVPPDFLQDTGRFDIENLVQCLQPDVLLFDDIDRAPHGLTFAITLVDDLRRLFPDVTIISTVNQIVNTNAALLRPGRLGVHERFESPDLEDRIELLHYYMEQYGVDRSKFQCELLAQRMVHPNFSHDYVRFIAEEAVVLDQEALLKSIENCNRHLDLIGNYIESDQISYTPDYYDEDDDDCPY